MSKKGNNIPVNAMTYGFSPGIGIDKNHIKKTTFTREQIEESSQSHRDEGHTFHILEKGAVDIEIDFIKYNIAAPAVVYLHPSQVHRITDLNDIVVCSLSISSENLNPAYLKLFEENSRMTPISLSNETSAVVAEMFSLCLKFSKEKNNSLYFPLLKDSCNSLTAYLLSQLLVNHEPENKFPRYDKVTKSFKQLLETRFTTLKRPNEYAELLNISVPYLNECIKNATGSSASQNIQDRIILEAKRLLYHTEKSVKEISFELGYTDYPYFSRLFSKLAGCSALTFRKKNIDLSNTYFG